MAARDPDRDLDPKLKYLPGMLSPIVAAARRQPPGLDRRLGHHSEIFNGQFLIIGLAARRDQAYSGEPLVYGCSRAKGTDTVTMSVHGDLVRALIWISSSQRLAAS